MAPQTEPKGSFLEVLRVFLRLGLTSFGGPVAHLGYFHEEFVTRRKWLDETGYADLVALCQFLPGPASSQVGFGLGVMRAGVAGGFAAWLGFTLPSALALTLFAFGVGAFSDVTHSGWLRGLKIVAVAVVAQALWGMAVKLAQGRLRATLAFVAAVITLLVPGALVQLLLIALGGLLGWRLLPAPPLTSQPPPAFVLSRRVGAILLGLFSRCCSCCRLPGTSREAFLSPSSTRSTGRVRWFSAVDMWCCPCSRLKSCPPAGWTKRRLRRVTEPHRPCRDRSLPFQRFLEQRRDRA